MEKSRSFLIVIFVLAALIVSVFSASGQEIDTDGMSTAELMTLLQGIMQKMEDNSAGETGTKAEPLPTATPAPTVMVLPLPDAGQLDLYENEQLLVLYRAIRQKFDSEGFNYEETAGPDPEKALHEIYKLKKLTVETLPGYMFTQPSKPSEGEPMPGPEDPGKPVPGTPCDPNFPNFCFWTSVDGEVVCICSELG